jgi:hypothetical protein
MAGLPPIAGEFATINNKSLPPEKGHLPPRCRQRWRIVKKNETVQKTSASAETHLSQPQPVSPGALEKKNKPTVTVVPPPYKPVDITEFNTCLGC